MTEGESTKGRADRIIQMVSDHLTSLDLKKQIYREVDQTLDELRGHQELVDFHRAIKEISLVHRKETPDGRNESEGPERSDDYDSEPS